MPPKLKSDLWRYFNKISDKVAECKYCGKHVKTSGNTSNLKAHNATHAKKYEAENKTVSFTL